jgi:hypothetical protein
VWIVEKRRCWKKHRTSVDLRILFQVLCVLAALYRLVLYLRLVVLLDKTGILSRRSHEFIPPPLYAAERTRTLLVLCPAFHSPRFCGSLPVVGGSGLLGSISETSF